MRLLYLVFGLVIPACFVHGAETRRGKSLITDIIDKLNKFKPAGFPSNKPSEALNKPNNHESTVHTTGMNPISEMSSECSGGQTQNPTRPCPKNKLSCVRNYFQAAADCQKFYCGNGDQLHMDHILLNTVFFNLTITQEDVTTSGLSSGKIIEFIVDYNTDLVVLAVQYTDIVINSSVTKFVYYQSAQQPKTIITTTNEFYPSVIITSYFSGAKTPQLSNAMHVANVTSLPEYTLGSCVTDTKDPVVKNLFRAFDANVAAAVQESYQSRAKVFQTEWLQKNVCNYGIDL